MEAKIWLRNYDDGTPHTLKPYPEKSLLDVVRDTARQRPDHPALLFKGARLSVSELDRLSDAFANALVALGVEICSCTPAIPRGRLRPRWAHTRQWLSPPCRSKLGLASFR